MKNARIMVAIIGVTLPYLARLPGGWEWVGQATKTGFLGFLFFGAFNAIAWGSILCVSLFYRRVVSLVFPAALGLGYLAQAYYKLDFKTDVEPGLWLIFLPLYSLGYVVVGAFIGLVVDRILIRKKGP
jgi:hypothetical protein